MLNSFFSDFGPTATLHTDKPLLCGRLTKVLNIASQAKLKLISYLQQNSWISTWASYAHECYQAFYNYLRHQSLTCIRNTQNTIDMLLCPRNVTGLFKLAS